MSEMKDLSISKILIIRFSSFGDIVQCMSILKSCRSRFPSAKIHWVTRKDFASILTMSSDIDRVFSLDKKEGLIGLVQLKNRLLAEKYDLVYDAHFNLRSRFLSWYLAPWPLRFLPFIRPIFVRRSKDRLKRLMLFQFGVNLFQWPFKGMQSFAAPLKRFGVKVEDNYHLEGHFDSAIFEKIEQKWQDFMQTTSGPVIALIPGAAWEMKRWPISYWKQLVHLLPQARFVLLGGPEDHFCQEIADVDHSRVLNLAGQCSLLASCGLLKRCDTFVSGDTGLLHVADILGMKGAALIGPTAFGFPTSSRIVVCESLLDCRPCTKDGRGKCSHQVYQYCLTALLPQNVANTVSKLLA